MTFDAVLFTSLSVPLVTFVLNGDAMDYKYLKNTSFELQ
jgi:hypothetical protein